MWINLTKIKKKYCEYLFILKIKHSIQSIFMFKTSLIIKIISKIEKSISILCSYFETVLKQNWTKYTKTLTKFEPQRKI